MLVYTLKKTLHANKYFYLTYNNSFFHSHHIFAHLEPWAKYAKMCTVRKFLRLQYRIVLKIYILSPCSGVAGRLSQLPGAGHRRPFSGPQSRPQQRLRRKYLRLLNLTPFVKKNCNVPYYISCWDPVGTNYP